MIETYPYLDGEFNIYNFFVYYYRINKKFYGWVNL